MKNSQGIIWAPILIIVASVIVAGIAGYFLFSASNTNDSENQNVAVVNRANSNTTANLNSSSTTNTNQVTNNDASVNTNTPANTNTSTDATTDSTAGWKTYTNSRFNFSIRHPNNWTVREVNDTNFSPTATLIEIGEMRFYPVGQFGFGLQGYTATTQSATLDGKSAIKVINTSSGGGSDVCWYTINEAPATGWNSGDNISGAANRIHIPCDESEEIRNALATLTFN